MHSLSSLAGGGCLAAHLVLSLIILLFFGRASAESGEELFEDHHAHEHGVAALNVAVEGNRVSIDFDSPAVNVVGFEHAPRLEAERSAAGKAEALLRDPNRLFEFPAEAACRPADSKLVLPQWQDGHGDYEATYIFSCRQPAALTELVVKLLPELTPGTKLRAQLITTSVQTSSELAGRNNTLRLR